MNTYLLFKSIHLIAVISWMAGLLYLPRIFVYHSEAVQNNKSEDLMETFKVMERRLLVYIMNPARIVSWIFGVLLIYTTGMDNFGFLWLQLKLVFVIIRAVSMKITSIEYVVLEELHPFVFIHTDDGVTGIGECFRRQP